MQTPQEMCESAGNTWVDGACMTDEQLAAAAKAREATAIANAIAAAKTAVDGLTDASSDADIMAASNAITAAHNAITGAQHASAADTTDSLEELAAIRMDLTTAQGGIDEHRQAAKDAANKVALSKKAAITAEGDATNTDNDVRPFDGGDAIADGATSNAAATTMYDVSVEHTGSAVEIGVRDERNLMDADPKFAKMAEFGNGQMLVRNIGTEREIIVVHTDIDAPTPTPFGTVHTLNANDDPDTTVVDNRSLTIINADHLAHIDLGIPKANEDSTRSDTFTQDDATTTNVDEGEHRGAFNGAQGTYDCASADCSATVNDKGETTALVGTWSFTPDAGVTIDVADPDYLTYGFWLDTTTKDGAIVSYDAVQTFAMTEAAVADSLGTVTGSASYAGGAAGVYVHETQNEDGTLNTATSGRFTADVDLTAYFAATTLRIDNTIEGSISDFDLNGGPANDWNVAVSATFTDGGVVTGMASGGVTGDTGSLSGQFYGPAAVNTNAPGILIGEFNSNFVNGSVAGAFGTRVEE